MGCGGSTQQGNNVNQGAVQNKERSTAGSDEEPEWDNEGSAELEQEVANSKDESKKERPEEGDFLFEVEDVGEGDQFMAVKPWIGALVAPSEEPENNGEVPDQTLTLEYVYGYRCSDSRQNVFYGADGRVVYMTAALGVVLNKDDNTQAFFGGGDNKDKEGHNDDIMALAVDSSRQRVATGQVGKTPIIYVWDAASQEKQMKLKQKRNTRQCVALGFSADGKYLASAGTDNDHTVHVFDLDTGKLAFDEKGGPDKIFDLAWSPTESKFVTAGIKHLWFWYFSNGTFQKKKKGLFGRAGKATNFGSCAFNSDGDAVSGGINGSVYLWKDRSLSKCEKRHKGGIDSMTCTPNGQTISGGRDHKICIMDNALNLQSTIDCVDNPRALDFVDGKLLGGFRNGDIAECDTNSGTDFITIMQSHSDGEVWGMDFINDGQIVTVADDNKIMKWDINERKCLGHGTVNEKKGKDRRAGKGASTLSNLPPNQQSRAVAVNTTGNGNVAVSDNEGNVTIRESADNLDTIVAELNQPKEWNEVMRYSPDGSKLGVGSHDNKIYIYETDGYSLVGTCSKHNSFITAFDWSEAGDYIHSVCGAYELLFFTADGEQDPSGATATRDERWSTYTTKLGWHVQGVFPSGTDGSHINGVHRSPDDTILATGDDWGLVNIFRWPCLNGAACKSYRGHSEHVTRVQFTADGSRLFSLGGYDQTVMQWKVE